MSTGIDYGMGKTNVDPETGIRYGVISQGDVCQAWADSSEGVYEQGCPKCGGDVLEDGSAALDAFFKSEPDLEPDMGEDGRRGGDCSWFCVACRAWFDAEEVTPDEAAYFKVDDGKYLATDCLDSDVMVLKSPYFTRAKFCSPCVPGAGNLNSPDRDGVETYCFGHDWFESEEAPYPVYSVATRKRVVVVRGTKECPTCKGTGKDSLQRIAEIRGESIEQVRKDVEEDVFFRRRLGQLGRKGDEFECFRCDGSGKVPTLSYEEVDE